MDKNSFLKLLDERLKNLTDSERKDILYDYEEHISAAVFNGEREEDVIEKLGSPELIARQFSASKMIRQAETDRSAGNVFRAVLATLGLGFLNLVFIVGPFFALVGVIIALLASSFSIVISGVAVIAVGVFGLAGGNLDLFVHLGSNVRFNQDYFSMGLVGAGVSLGSLGSLMSLGSFWLTKWFYKLTLEYLKLNLRIIQGRPLSRMEREAHI